MSVGGSSHTDPYIQAFQRGEEKGFSFFFRELYKPLCLFADRYLNQMDKAEDIVADTFVRLWEKREGITGIKTVRSYLYGAVRNACLNELKKQPRVPSAITGQPDKTMLENMIRAEVLQEIYITIEQLPHKCKRIFTKLYIEGKTVREIADELQLSVSTVKTQKTIALAFIRSRLSPLFTGIFLSVYLWC